MVELIHEAKVLIAQKSPFGLINLSQVLARYGDLAASRQIETA